MMRSKSIFLLAALLVVGCDQTTGNTPTIASPGAALASKPPADSPVTTTISDVDLTIAPTLQIQSDHLGVYQNSSTLTSIIQSIGSYLLDSYTPRNSTRTVYVDFSQPIAGSGPNGGNPVAIPSGLYKVHMISKCNPSMLTLAPGATMPCPLHLGSLIYAGGTYAVQMNPLTTAGDTSYAETNYANVTCTFPTSGAGPCTQWKIAPSGTYIAADSTTKYRNVGKLLKQGTQSVNQGDFYFSFVIGLTKP